MTTSVKDGRNMTRKEILLDIAERCGIKIDDNEDVMVFDRDKMAEFKKWLFEELKNTERKKIGSAGKDKRGGESMTKICFCHITGGVHNYDFHGYLSESGIEYYRNQGCKVTRVDCPLVEIVTCKDCKHNCKNICDVDGSRVTDNFHCAGGERGE